MTYLEMAVVDIVISVVVALVLIIVILRLFPTLIGIEQRKDRSARSAEPSKEVNTMPQNRVNIAAEATEATEATEVAEGTPMHAEEDEALIAVIAGAIATASGHTPGSFVTTSLYEVATSNEGGFNTPVWGRAERLARLSQNNATRGVRANETL